MIALTVTGLSISNAGMVTDAGTPPTEQQAALRATYAANLAALYRVDATLAAAIDALPFGQCPALETARDDNFTLQVPGDAGRPIYLHSRYRPKEEASKLVAAQAASAAPVFFVSGCGLGYHLIELDQQCDRPLVILAENDLRLLKLTLCLHDLTPAFRDNRLLILTRADKSVLHEKLGRMNADLMLGVQFLTPPAASRYQVEFHRQVRTLMTEYVAYSKIQMVTLLRNARVTNQNILFNLPYYLDQAGVHALRDRARGFPAIVVAAGPSLARNIDQLARWQSHAVVIAVQTVFKNLLARGIEPHFVASLDFHEISRQFFEGIETSPRTTLVAEPKASWHVLDAYPGEKYVLDNLLYERLLREKRPARGGLEPGTTVAHLCFYLAVHLGCDPIIFIGQDLSFTEAMYYAPGMPIEQVWQPELHRFHTAEMKQWERIVRHRRILHSVEDLHGRPAYSDDQMVSYAEQFESDFAKTDRRVIQASEGGRALRGMDVMDFNAAAERFCTRRVPPDLLPSAAGEKHQHEAEAAVAQLGDRLAEVRKMRTMAEETVQLLKKMEGLVTKPTEFNRLVGRADELRIEMQRFQITYNIVVSVSQQAELRRYTADRKLLGIQKETADTARQRLTRDREYVESFVEACDFVADLLPQAIERTRERLL